MPREAELSVNERAFVLQALGERIRIDGRKFDEFRELDLKFGDDHGVAHVTLGKTKCVSPDSYWITALTYPPQGHCTNISRGDQAVCGPSFRWSLHHHHGAESYCIASI